LTNTNSSHTINFNQSIVLLYEFQSNINGFILNVTTNIAKTYNNGIVPVVAIYEVISCPTGQLPFTPQCPGQLQTAGSPIGSNPTKGSFSLKASNGQIPVSNGQWVAIGVTSNFGPLDLNDTNTNVPLFQTSTLSGIQNQASAASLSAGCKIGLWTWIVGNVVTGGGALTPPPNLSCPGILDCILPNLVFSFCSNQTPACTNASALLWAMILSIVTTFFTLKGGGDLLPGVRIPIGEIFTFSLLIWIFVMSGLTLLFVWVPLFFFFAISLVYGKHTGKYL
jgi:hypothetical protein